MNTRADDLKIDIAKLKAQLSRNDADIEDHEYRQSLRRKHGDRLYNRLLLLEDQLRREEAPLVKPQPHGVKIGGFDV